ncbi:MAG: GNAT family N-acetyltransferase [Desulfobacterales bacterium]|nr:GNAT family N-acetyltransferase [Desulfobacterales bacterium]
MEILQATTDADMDVIRVLFREYENYLQVDLCFQSFEAELAELPGKYAPPEGALLMAAEQGNVLGCVALKKLEDGVCEMKRLYVRPDARGTGLGRQLAVRIIRAAREIGYREMRLDTLDKLTAAIALYRSIGFRETDPYYSNPLPGVVYLTLDL